MAILFSNNNKWLVVLAAAVNWHVVSYPLYRKYVQESIFIYDTFVVVVFFFGTMITAFKEMKMLYFILYLPIQINF